MRQRLLLPALLGLNVVLAAGWIYTAVRASRQTAATPATSPTEPARIKTNVLVRRQFFSWQELESTDYPTYIANLRNICCPEQTIRDIIVADVNQLYARRLAQQLPTTDQRWWSNAANREQIQAARRMSLELDKERRALLTQLLGTNWDTTVNIALASTAGTVVRPGDHLTLDGPILGTLSPDAVKAVRDLVNQAEADARKLGAGARNPAEVVRLEKELWRKLAGLLSPQQLEEFRLRYSPDAAALRRKLDGLRFFETTPDEFRGLFRATADIDGQLRALGTANDPETLEKRRSLEQQREAAIKLSLGLKRYAEYVRLQDPDYQAAVAKAQAAGASDRAAQTLYQIDQASATESAIVDANPNLTDSQKEIEKKRIELEQAKAQARALGQELPPEPTTTPPPPKSASSISHIMGSTESLSSLSRLYGVSAQALQEANPGVDLDNLKPGDTVKIPYLAPPPMPPR